MLYYKSFLTILVFILYSNNHTLIAENLRSKWENENTLESQKSRISSLNELNIKNLEPKISLVLSGGGARGFAQIGVLKSLEKNEISIHNIVGTSIGALIGGLYASGYNATELDSLARNTNWNEIFSLNNEIERSEQFIDQKIENDRSLLTLRFIGGELQVPKAISTGNSFNAFLQNLFWRSGYQPYGDFNKLKYPYRAVTTDLISGQVISISNGDLVKAIRASATVPLRYTPIEMDGLLLVDGGILANIPINQTKEFVPNFILTINSSSPKFEKEKLNTPWNIADQVVMTMSEKINDWYKTPDLILQPPIGDYSNTNFDSVSTLIEIGFRESESKIKNFENTIYQYKDSVFKVFLIQNEINQQTITKILNGEIKIKYENFKTFEVKLFENYLKSIQFDEADNKFIHTEEWHIAKEEFFKFLKFYYYFNINFDKSNNTITFGIYNYKTIKKVEVIVNDENLQKSEIKYQNTDLYKVRELSKILNSQIVGDEFSPNNKLKIEQKITKYLRDNQLYFNNLEEINFDNDLQILSVVITPILINKIDIKGNHTIAEYQIKRELIFEIGEFPNPDKLDQSWQNLMATDLFYYVSFDFKIDNELNIMNVIINVEEKGTNIINIGARTDNERQGQVGIDLKKINLFGTGSSISTNFFGGNRNQFISFNLENNRIYSTNLGLKISTYYDKRNIYRYAPIDNMTIMRNEYRNERIGEWAFERFGGKINIAGQLEKLGKTYVEFRYEKQRTIDFINKNTEPYYQITTLKIGSIVDTENDKYYPTSGSLAYVDFESSLLNNSPNFSFTKINIFYQTYLGWNDFILKPKLNFGAADNTTPVPEQYGLGNEPSFFGMREEENRGRQIFVSSLEARYKLPLKVLFNTYFSFRYDLGNVWSVPTDIKFATLRHGGGFTLGIDSPIGPAKFSLGRSFYFLKNPNTVVLGEIMGYFSIGVKL